MIELIIVVYMVLCVVLFSYSSYQIGYVKGMEKIINMDNEYDHKFKELIVDFVTEKYVRKTDKEMK